ncbi:MAG: glycosyltransferase family A protein [Candidatus Binatia bacterium]
MVPTVSVIVPTYNRWPMVGAAVASVLAQRYRDFELIVVDDGSTDETSTELARVGSQLRYFYQDRGGVSAARNLGVRQSRGRLIAFLDSDDLWQPDKLQVQVAFMATHPEVQICQTDEVWIRHGVRVNPKLKHRKPSGDIFERSLELCLVSPSAAMMTRELFDRSGGFDESLPVCEDYDLWLRIARDHPVPLIEQALVVKHGGHDDQLSHSVWGMDRYRVAALQKLLRAGIAGQQRRAVLRVLQNKLAVLAHGARKRGKAADADGYRAMLSEFAEEISDVGEWFSKFRGGEGLSSADAGPLA